MSEDDPTQIQYVHKRRDSQVAPCVVVLTGRKIGRVFQLKHEGCVFGRAPDCDLVLDDDGVSRVHCMVSMEDGRWVVRDLGSTNGTFVGERTVGKTPLGLQDGDRIRLGSDLILKFGAQDEIEVQFLDHLYRSATRDSLTGLANRRYLAERLRSEVAWHRRHQQPLTVMMVDIDHFKRINDTFGHLTGDEVLQEVAEILRGVSRAEDCVARYGGEEFVLVLRQTAVEAGRRAAERLRAAVASHDFALPDDHGVTVSVGVVTRVGDEITNAKDLLSEADTYLYMAKERGRNRVVPV